MRGAWLLSLTKDARCGTIDKMLRERVISGATNADTRVPGPTETLPTLQLKFWKKRADERQILCHINALFAEKNLVYYASWIWLCPPVRSCQYSVATVARMNVPIL